MVLSFGMVQVSTSPFTAAMNGPIETGLAR
jgi:hypothetical protein